MSTATEVVWCVVSPEYEYTEPILDDGSGPRFPVADVVYVTASGRRQAIVEGVRVMRRIYRDGWHNGEPNANPFSGMKAYAVTDTEELVEARAWMAQHAGKVEVAG